MRSFQFLVLALLLMLGLTGFAPVQDQPPDGPQAMALLILDATQPEDAMMSATYLGEAAEANFSGIDPARITMDGKPLDDELRQRWAEAPGTMAFATDLVIPGQLFQLYDGNTHLGFARVIQVDYNFESASFSDHLTVMLELGQPLTGEANILFAVAKDAPRSTPPRPLTIDAQDGGTWTADVDIDADGVKEMIVWDPALAPTDEEGVFHPLQIMRGNQMLQTLEFFYDNDYTHPLDPQLIDLNGDGIYELILSGEGHNTYVSVYQWRDGAFSDTQASYYSGD